VLEFGFKLDFLVCTYAIDPICTQFRLGQNSTWNVTTAKSGECLYIRKFFEIDVMPSAEKSEVIAMSVRRSATYAAFFSVDDN
jgi:hypothetical protein